MNGCSGGTDDAVPPEQPPEEEAGTVRCARCGRPVARGAAFTLGTEHRCLGCSLRYGPMLRRSTLTSLVVGTLLIAINQGGVLLSGSWPASLAWQIPLTYLVPFCVATWGALSNTRGA
jgi:hypothetical protein